MFYQILLLPQGKQCAVITNESGIYEVTQELPNDLRFMILAN